jgi:hypothetical protein
VVSLGERVFSPAIVIVIIIGVLSEIRYLDSSGIDGLLSPRLHIDYVMQHRRRIGKVVSDLLARPSVKTLNGARRDACLFLITQIQE